MSNSGPGPMGTNWMSDPTDEDKPTLISELMLLISSAFAQGKNFAEGDFAASEKAHIAVVVNLGKVLRRVDPEHRLVPSWLLLDRVGELPDEKPEAAESGA